MDTITTPATKLSVTDWTYLTVVKQLAIKDQTLEPMVTGTAQVGTLEFLGDADGKPVAQISAQLGQSNFRSITLPLDEEVTRADGSKLSVLALLDAILSAAATQA